MKTGAHRFIRPRVDILSGDQDFLIRADMPGVGADDVDLRVEGTTLTLVGRRSQRPAYKRQFIIPQHTDVDAVTAGLRHGVLEVTVPKTSASRARTIPIAVG